MFDRADNSLRAIKIIENYYTDSSLISASDLLYLINRTSFRIL